MRREELLDSFALDDQDRAGLARELDRHANGDAQQRREIEVRRTPERPQRLVGD